MCHEPRQGQRRYDAVTTINTEKTKYEFKAWETEDFYVSSMRVQFIKDLTKMTKIDELKWIFKQNAFWGDAASFKNKIKGALMPNGVPCTQLDNVFETNKIKFAALVDFGGDANYLTPSQFLTLLFEDPIFTKLFTRK